MPKFNHRGIVIGLAAVIALLLGLTVAPTALAHGVQEQEFDMNARFASAMGASGSGESEVNGGFVEVQVDAEGLLPHHQYEMKITIGACPPDALSAGGCDSPAGEFLPVVVTCGWEESDHFGEVRFDCHLDLVELLGAGTYRLDFFLTHFHFTGPGKAGTAGVPISLILDRDPLLRCSPASLHTVPQVDDD